MERHSLDVLSLLFGLVFTGLALTGLLDVFTLRELDVRWVGPGLLVLFGVALVLTAGRVGDTARRNGPPGTAPTGAPAVGGDADAARPGDATTPTAEDPQQDTRARTRDES